MWNWLRQDWYELALIFVEKIRPPGKAVRKVSRPALGFSITAWLHRLKTWRDGDIMCQHRGLPAWAWFTFWNEPLGRTAADTCRCGRTNSQFNSATSEAISAASQKDSENALRQGSGSAGPAKGTGGSRDVRLGRRGSPTRAGTHS